MKDSEKYTNAMLAVINSTMIMSHDKLEIIEELLSDRSLALYREKEAEKKEAAEE